MEILLIDNGSNEENRKKTEQLVEEIRTAGTPIRYVYEPAEFNFSTMCNRGAELADGKLLLFLNDDMNYVRMTGWIKWCQSLAALCGQCGTETLLSGFREDPA